MNIKLISLTLLFFAITINSSFPSNTLIGLLIILNLLFTFDSSVNHHLIQKVFIAYIFLLILYLSLPVSIDAYSSSINRKLLFGFLFLAPVMWIMKNSKTLSIKALNINAYFLVFFWYLQFILVFLFGINLDILDSLGIRESKTQDYLNLGTYFGISARASGIFHEPGTYGSITGLILITLHIVGNKDIRLINFYLLSCLLSLSTFSIIAAATVAALTYWKEINLFSRSRRGSGIIIISLILIFAYTYIELRGSLNIIQSGFFLRTESLNNFIASDMTEFLLGHQFEDRKILRLDGIYYDTFIEDSGFVFFMLFIHGLIPIMCLFFLIGRNLFVRIFLYTSVLKISSTALPFTLLLLPFTLLFYETKGSNSVAHHK
tara:strand:+ start:8633 stop:9760 length:1128 start_codon:yes stop_codon:yes gene_type:complete